MIVYKAIGAVSAAMSHSGISKGRKNQQQGYNFRGIDDVLNALSTALVDAGLVILPRCVERIVVERETKSGGALFNVTCRVEFDLVSTEDGSKHTVSTYGEAMDSADKATNKAMSAAYKYLALLVFCIPTEASPETDADFTTHQTVGVPAVTTTRGGVMGAVLHDMPPMDANEAEFIGDLAVSAIALHKVAGISNAFDRIEAEMLDNDQKTHLWNLLPSDLRSALKKEGEKRKVSA